MDISDLNSSHREKKSNFCTSETRDFLTNESVILDKNLSTIMTKPYKNHNSISKSISASKSIIWTKPKCRSCLAAPGSLTLRDYRKHKNSTPSSHHKLSDRKKIPLQDGPINLQALQQAQTRWYTRFVYPWNKSDKKFNCKYSRMYSKMDNKRQVHRKTMTSYTVPVLIICLTWWHWPVEREVSSSY